MRRRIRLGEAESNNSAFYRGGKMIFGIDEVLFEVASDEKYYIYIPTRGLISLIDSDKKNEIINTWKDGLPEYVRKYPYISISDIEKKELDVLPSLSINISDGCQLRCQYCYLSASSVLDDRLMTFEEGKKFFDAYIKHLYENYKDRIETGHPIWVSFFGGAEPTYNNVFESLVNYIKGFADENNLHIRLRITTNGYYGESTARFIAENFNKILLSFDGNEMAQNEHRKVADGSGSFTQVYNTAKLFYNFECDFSIRMTVSSETIKYLRDSLEFFSKEFEGTKILIGKVSKIGRAEDYDIDCIDDFGKIINRLIEEYKEKLSFSLLEKKDLKNIHTCYCGAAQAKHFIISKDGSIKTCAHYDENEEFVIGNVIDDELVFDNKKIKNMQEKYNVRKREDCSECIAKYYCAGGCPSTQCYSYEDYKNACQVQKEAFLIKFRRELSEGKLPMN